MSTLSRNMVLAAFRAEHFDDLAPDAASLGEYEQGLKDEYEAEVIRQEGDAGIPDTEFNRSILIYFANQSTASRTKRRVEEAVRFFDAVSPVP